MAVLFLTETTETNKSKGLAVWEAFEQLSIAGPGAAILAPEQSGLIGSCLVALIISSGSGKVQYTISSRSSVLADQANWIDWDSGTVNTTTNDVFYPVTAIRQYNVSGATKIEVRSV